MFQIVQVSVGMPTCIGLHRGKEAFSSIVKRSLGTPVATVTADGIVGDRQADTRIVNGKRIHGGPLKAIYAYPYKHLEPWAVELGVPIVPGTLGENLTIAGLSEQDVRIGDVFAWDDVVLEVTSPRRPCYKLPLHLGVPDVARQMNQNGRCGFYLKVVRPGEARVDARLELMASDQTSPTVAQVFAAKVRADPAIPDS